MALFILCIKIFIVRIIDVSMGTFRTILTVKGKTVFSSIVGFIEILIWFLIVKEALNTTETSLWVAISYAGGFATGTYIGGLLSTKFIKGTLGVQVIMTGDSKEVVKTIRENGYAVSMIDIQEHEDGEIDKYMLFIEINKHHFSHLQNIIKSLDDKAFIVVNETKYVQNGYFKAK